jgi:adenylate cyclase
MAREIHRKSQFFLSLLDDSQPLAHALSGEILLFKGQSDQALGEGERAIVVGPNFPLAYFWLADILNRSARPAEAIGLVDKAMRLDPQLANLYAIQKGIAYNRLGRYSEAIPIVKSHLARYPNDLAGHILMIVDCMELGRQQEARAEVADVLRIDPKFSLDLFRQRVPDKDGTWLQHRDADLRKAGLT